MKAFLGLFAALCMVSCDHGERSSELQKYEEAKEQVATTQAELKVLQAEVRKAQTEGPKVPVAETEAELEKKEAAVVASEEELEKLTKKLRATQEEFSAYQDKYPLKK